MLILLPPSEGKADAGDGAPVDLAGLSLPELRRARDRAVKALVKLSSAKSTAAQNRALDALGLTDGQRGELARNAALPTAGTLPAAQLYTGVLYDALDLATLGPAAVEAAQDSLLISSGLWGVVRLNDRIPPYRCSIGAKLPVLGGLTAYWKKALEPVMTREAADGLVLDLRSGAYAAAWTPRGEVAERTAQVRVLHERDGKRTVVSHFNKATKGRIIRDLLVAGAAPSTPRELAVALRDSKYTVEEQSPVPGKPRQLDVVVREL
ncbi:MAG: peroxide stress protein YaaA [Hamadaea sp.]|nr:peroxide stress protein YaaA [Hamadaea sp.]